MIERVVEDPERRWIKIEVRVYPAGGVLVSQCESFVSMSGAQWDALVAAVGEMRKEAQR